MVSKHTTTLTITRTNKFLVTVTPLTLVMDKVKSSILLNCYFHVKSTFMMVATNTAGRKASRGTQLSGWMSGYYHNRYMTVSSLIGT